MYPNIEFGVRVHNKIKFVFMSFSLAAGGKMIRNGHPQYTKRIDSGERTRKYQA